MSIFGLMLFNSKKRNMKKIRLLSCVLAFAAQSKSQTVTPVLVSSQGGFASLSGGSVSWSIGEPVSASYTHVSAITTMGFHQPELTVASVIDENEAGQSIGVFPNPVNDILSLNFSGIQKGAYRLEVIDGLGKIVLVEDAQVSDQAVYKLSLGGLSAGNYLLKITNGEKAKSVKINKIN
jgi:hypothetical protein